MLYAKGTNQRNTHAVPLGTLWVEGTAREVVNDVYRSLRAHSLAGSSTTQPCLKRGTEDAT